MRPLFLVVGGAPGSGKSTIAAALAQRLGVAQISRDEIKSGIAVSAGLDPANLPPVDGHPSTPRFFRLVRHFLDADVSVIADHTFEDCRLHSGLYDEHWAPLEPLMVWCSTPVAANRAAARDEYLAGDAKYVANPPAWPRATLVVDTTEGYKPSLDEIVRWIGTEA